MQILIKSWWDLIMESQRLSVETDALVQWFRQRVLSWATASHLLLWLNWLWFQSSLVAQTSLLWLQLQSLSSKAVWMRQYHDILLLEYFVHKYSNLGNDAMTYMEMEWVNKY